MEYWVILLIGVIGGIFIADRFFKPGIVNELSVRKIKNKQTGQNTVSDFADLEMILQKQDEQNKPLPVPVDGMSLRELRKQRKELQRLERLKNKQ